MIETDIILLVFSVCVVIWLIAWYYFYKEVSAEALIALMFCGVMYGSVHQTKEPQPFESFDSQVFEGLSANPTMPYYDKDAPL